MIQGFAILFLVLALSEAIVRWLSLPLPGSVLGMVLLLLLLRLGVVKVPQVRDAANLLLSNLALLFIPAGVGVMLYLDLVRENWLPISVSLVLSTFVVLLVTGKVVASLARAGRGRDHG